jgi:outer membrane protein assembly factor BamB
MKKIVLGMLLFTLALGATDRWSHTAGDDVKWMRSMWSGGFVYATEGGIYALDPATGNKAWSREDLKKVQEFNVEEIPGSPLLFVSDNTGGLKTKARLVAIDLMSGETVWESEQLKGLIVDLVSSYSKNLVMMVTIPAGAAKSKLDVTAFHIPTGKVLWEADIEDKADLFIAEKSSGLFKKLDLSGHAQPTVTDNAVYFAYAGLHKIDLATGKVLWKSAYDVTEAAYRRANASPLVDSGIVYTSAKGQIRAFDDATGALKWTSADFGAAVAETQVADGVLYGRMGGAFYQLNAKAYELKKPLGVVALDPANGQVKWKYEGAKDALTNMAVVKDAGVVMIADAKNLIGLSMDASGNKVKETFRVPLEFKQKQSAGGKAMKIGFGALRGGAIGAVRGAKGGPGEAPLVVAPRPNGLLAVRGAQHLLAFDPKKREIAWATQVEPPGASMFVKIATSAAFAMLYTAQTAQAFSTQRGTMENDWSNSSRVKIMDDWGKVMDKRFKKSGNTEEYAYMLSDIKNDEGKGAGIVGINLNTGEIERRLLFKDKEPEYVVDEVDGVVFRTHKNGKDIVATEIR